ncbi:MAG TPA: cell wall-binding repeat-containing protein [Acidimicrobiales bacterium]|nr:cell wall-binding repeat-containing protein [Acidimicrobiales bacterium]
MPAPAAASTTPPSISVSGHGWGHGRGLGQWGALGYALSGQSYSSILSHFYGGTTMGSVANSSIRVRMVENDGNDIIVTSQSAFSAAGHSLGGGQAVLMHLSGPGVWQVSTGPSCAGPWTAAGTGTDGGTSPTATVGAVTSDPAAPRSQLLQLCTTSGNLYLRGAIAAAEVGGVARTVNVVPLESYLRGVVTSESPAYWGAVGPAGPQGQAQGFQALEAQAVAARSYAVADEHANGGTGSYGYADICDTTSCQVYRGVAGEASLGNAAVSDTAGQVRVTGAGAVVSTEFSSSSGGWTSGGTFPAVEDAGDNVCVTSACNPNHNWTASVSPSAVQSAYPSIGTFSSASVTGRTGPAAAAWGGRVTQVRLSGSSGAVTITGGTFAARFGLKSDFFALAGDAGGTGSTSTSTSTTSSTSTSTSTTSTTVPPAPIFPGVSVRVAGADRDGTAVAASRVAFPAGGSAHAAVLARSDAYADALAGAPLAASKHGPLLLTGPLALDPTALAEIQRAVPAGEVIYVLGGTAAVSPSIDTALISHGYKVVRIEGNTRYATAVAVATQLGNPHTVFEASGTDFPDGLTAGPAAISQGAAVLLTSGPGQSSETASYLAAHPGDVRFAVGAPAVHADPTAQALAGPDRYTTSAAVAGRFFVTPSVIGAATGTNFPDALAAGPALGTSGPLLLVPPSGPVPDPMARYLAAVRPGVRTLEAFGGTDALAPTALGALLRSLG